MTISGVLIWLVAALPVLAQQMPAAPVTEDDVMDVAEHMYCPVCEMEPLDDCRVPTCIEWKAEIRRQLEAGRDPDTIINDFVARYGEHVVGVPQDPFLRTLSLLTPVVLALLVAAVGVFTFWRWQQNRPEATPTSPAPEADNPPASAEHDNYRDRLERDL